jgi:precorrin-2 dehydrogenase/sirohydrochlorin ferrochelatase
MPPTPKSSGHAAAPQVPASARASPVFPVCLNVAGRHCMVFGGGEVAERKVLSLLECGAHVTVVAPEVCPSLRELAARGRIVLELRPYRRGDLACKPFLVFAATNDETVHRQLWEEAEANNILINVVDVPQLCNFIMPSILRRGDLCIAISTGGRSPALARRIRLALEEHFPADFGELLLRVSEVREFVKERMQPGRAREAMLSTIAEPEVLELLRQGRVEEVKQRYLALLAEHPERMGDP